MGEKNKKFPLRAGATIILSAGILIGNAAMPFGTMGTLQAEAAVVTYETTANLNMRQGASTKANIVLTIPKGKQVTFISQNGAWFKVKYGSKEGWVSSSYLMKTATPSTNIAGTSLQKPNSYETTSNLNLQSSASADGSKVLEIPKGEEVIFITKKGKWYNVKYGNKTGWVSADNVKVITKTTTVKPNPTPPPVVEVSKNFITTGMVNMRGSSSATGEILTVIPKGTEVKSSGEQVGNWTKVSYDKKTGFVSNSYLYEITKETADKIAAYEKNPYVMMDLRTKSSVTADQINQYLRKVGNVTAENSVLHNTGQLFIDAANKYGLNALYLAAHAIHESAYGKSVISKEKFNLFGYTAFDSAPFIAATRFDSVASGIEFLAQQMKATYLNPNDPTKKYNGAYLGYTIKDDKGKKVEVLSAGMNFYYATDSDWGSKIAKHMEGILPSSQEAAFQQQPNIVVPSEAVVPDLKDVFPAGTLAVANKAISLYDINGVKSATIQKGETFNLLEKSNSFKLTVKYNGETYYTDRTSFSRYYELFTVQNLARVVETDVVNVREEPSTSSDLMGTLPRNQFVELILDKDQNPIIENKHWYNVQFGDGKTAWIHGSYLELQLNREK